MKRLSWAVLCVPLMAGMAGCGEGAGQTESTDRGTGEAQPSDSTADVGVRASIVPADDTTFDRHVVMSDVPVLVDFSAPWCEPCQLMEPRLQAIAEQFAGRLRVVQVNIDESRRLARHYEIKALPTIYLFENGRVVEKSTGLMRRSELVQMVNRQLEAIAGKPAEGAGLAERAGSVATDVPPPRQDTPPAALETIASPGASGKASDGAATDVAPAKTEGTSATPEVAPIEELPLPGLPAPTSPTPKTALAPGAATTPASATTTPASATTTTVSTTGSVPPSVPK